MNIELGLMRFRDLLKVKREKGKRYIFDPIRKKWLVLLPEELVRQLVIHYLLEEKNYNRNRINLERGLRVNSLQKLIRCRTEESPSHCRPSSAGGNRPAVIWPG